MREQFEQAAVLIKQKRYADARDHLRSMNDPKALEWLQKLEAQETKGDGASSPGLSARFATLSGVLMGLLVISALVLMLGGRPNVRAQDDPLANGAEAVNLVEMAQYFPEDTTVFSAMRLDDAYIDNLESLWELSAEPLKELYLPAITLRQLIAQTTAQNMTGVDVLTIFGDRAAFGAIMQDMQSQYRLVIDVTDQAAVDKLALLFYTNMANAVGGQMSRREDNDTIYYEGAQFTVSLSPTLLTITDIDQPFLESGTPLLETTLFQETVGELPLDHYNILVFSGLDEALYASPVEVIQTVLGMSPAAYAMGGTILGGDTLVWDMSLSPEQTDAQTVQGINPEFARYVPINSTLVLHGTNLSGLVSIGLAVASQNDPNTDPVALLQGYLGMVKLDLEDDILSWSEGDFAAFGRFEAQDMLKLGLRSMGEPFAAANFADQFDFGLVMETTDAEASQRLLTTIEGLLNQAVSTTPSDAISVYSSTIGGISTTNILITSASSNPADNLPVELVMGANDDIIFIMTIGAARQVFEADAKLTDSPVYTESKLYWLANPTSAWYADANGTILTAGAPVWLALSGPTIGNIFSNISAGLRRDQNITPSPTPSPTPTPIPSPTPNYEVVVDQVFGSFRHATITTTITEGGAHQVRLTMSLNPGR